MLTLQFIPYGELSSLSSEKKIQKLLRIVREDKIVLLEGKLGINEKSELIRKTMEEIDDKFKGIEIEDLDLEKKDKAFFEKIRTIFINFILGSRKGMTIIGPASIIKEIKKDPDKIQLFTEDTKKKKKK
ncbi:MAG: DUF2073 domain-containing protein [Nanoarchaeota archaeon]|nr:DUF2073 domain-containing protein [Nanoarchaeota archaeon]MBU1321601.1 DUF2073 domain-containing protein [Nanoarchaeota archaeon]MBU1598005.1 DUF2073 domain-containing protein [Nanoarchaeota archaeon]MBU2440955.1 DUF2073 domain-containing protein [Nanoarchaeota archaeon]